MGLEDYIHVIVAEVKDQGHLKLNCEIEDAQWFGIHALKQKIKDEKLFLLEKCCEIANVFGRSS